MRNEFLLKTAIVIAVIAFSGTGLSQARTVHRHKKHFDQQFQAIMPPVQQKGQSAADQFNDHVVMNGMTQDELDRKSVGY